MSKKEFDLDVPGENRHIKLRFNSPKNAKKSYPLVIIATGLYSSMNKDSQIKLAESYQKAGFSTLQFNFMGHGENKNKSEGDIKNVTLSSGIKDIKAVWDYAKTLSNKVNTNDIVISGSSYGAVVALVALENKLISPESMVLVAPFSFEKLKSWSLPVRLLAILAPSLIAKIFKIPVHPALVQDLAKNHYNAITKKNLLGNTAVLFFVGDKDNISSGTDIKKWCQMFNENQPNNIPFVGGVQAQYKIYDNVPHFQIPANVYKDIHKRSIDFIKKTHAIGLK